MMIEQNTNYAYKLKYMDNPTFDKVRDLSIKFYRELPQALQDELYEALNRGIDILDSEPQMTAYLFAFGKMHQAKLNYAFGKLSEEFFEQPEINIIDYGCGQALGTMCYADFLRNNGYTQKVRAITLNEPSEVCLKRAALHASAFFPDAEIKTVNKKFDDLTQDDIVCNEETPTLHILSNVLDMLNFDLERFAELVKGCLKGYNQFVCVGPCFNYSNKDRRINIFNSSLEGNVSFCKIFDKYSLDIEKAWTAQILCFSVGKLLSTEVSEDIINAGVVDSFGVVYDGNGKRLLKCINQGLKCYTIKNGTKIICDNAFDGITVLELITIPDSVKIIGDEAFIDCSSLQDILIPDSITSIGDGVFYNCSSLQQITIPDSVISFNDVAFVGCSSLQRVTLPNSVTKIDQFAFSGCASLRQLTIPETVTKIGRLAFSRCISLQQISIPDSVVSISYNAFESCYSLQQIIIPRGRLTKFKSILNKALWDKIVELSTNESISRANELTTPSTEKTKNAHVIRNEDVCGVVYSKDGKRLLRCNNPELETYSIKNGTVEICYQAFGLCSLLSQITIPDSVKKIDDQAFLDCQSLQQIVLPDSVTSIGYNAFGLCKSLKRINIPNSVTSLEPAVFYECISLQQISIPNSITRIEYQTFSECSSLQQVSISNSVSLIGDWAFSKCKSLKQIIIPNSVKYLGEGAFSKCESLQHVTLPDSLCCIGAFAFEECKSMQTINIPYSVNHIQSGAFSRCTSLKQITISNSATQIGDEIFFESAFKDCRSLQQIIIPKGSTEKFKKMLDKDLWDKLVEK